MLDRIIGNFVCDICTYNGYNDIQKEQIIYTLKVIIYEMIKFTMLIGIFTLLGYGKECVLVTAVMISTKPFTGGYHEDNQLKCFFATTLLIAIIIYLSISVNLDFISSVILNFISVFSIYNRAPIINPKMPLTREDLIKRNRVIGITNTIIICSISLLIFTIDVYSQVLIWSVFVQAILMFNKRE